MNLIHPDLMDIERCISRKSRNNPHGLSKNELQEICRRLGLSTSGNKDDLCRRMHDYIIRKQQQRQQQEQRAQISQLPAELVYNITKYLDPASLAKLTEASRKFSAFDTAMKSTTIIRDGELVPEEQIKKLFKLGNPETHLYYFIKHIYENWELDSYDFMTPEVLLKAAPLLVPPYSSYTSTKTQVLFQLRDHRNKRVAQIAGNILDMRRNEQQFPEDEREEFREAERGERVAIVVDKKPYIPWSIMNFHPIKNLIGKPGVQKKLGEIKKLYIIALQWIAEVIELKELPLETGLMVAYILGYVNQYIDIKRNIIQGYVIATLALVSRLVNDESSLPLTEAAWLTNNIYTYQQIMTFCATILTILPYSISELSIPVYLPGSDAMKAVIIMISVSEDFFNVTPGVPKEMAFVDNVNEFMPENESDVVEILKERYPTAVANQDIRSFIDRLRA